MIRKNQRLLNFINMAADASIILVSYFCAMYIRFSLMGGIWNLTQEANHFFKIALAYSLVLVLVFYGFKLYGSYRYKSIGVEWFTLAAINGVGILILMALAYIFRVIDYPRMLFGLFWIVSSIFLFLKRYIVRKILHHYRALGYNQKFAVVVGNGRLAGQYIQDVKNSPWLGLRISGYVSAVEKEGYGTCLGRYEDLDQILENQTVDELIVALEPHEGQFMKTVLETADKHGVRISIIPYYNEYIPSHPSIEVIGESKLINMRATPLDNIGWAMVKRGTDIIGALILIVLTSPIMLLTAIGVKISSPGPILFKQERVGKDKKIFRMLKFRSMRMVDMEKTKDTAWSTNEDPRKTKFGSFIRKCSIDELPQFFNVLKGDMSLIGPRPEIPYHVNHFKEEIPLYLVRQQVRPGITGWAQVNGYRGDTSIVERVKYDIWYIENWSIGLDMKIVWKTVFGGMINDEKV